MTVPEKRPVGSIIGRMRGFLRPGHGRSIQHPRRYGLYTRQRAFGVFFRRRHSQECGGAVRARHATLLLKDAADAVNGLFRRTVRSQVVPAVRTDLRNMIAEAFDHDGPLWRSDFGVWFDFRDQSTYTLAFFGNVQTRFTRALRFRSDEIRNFFLQPHAGADQGLIDKTIQRLEAAESDIRQTLGSVGLFVSAVV